MNDVIAFQSNMITQAEYDAESLPQNLFFMLIAMVNRSDGKKLSHTINKKMFEQFTNKKKINVTDLETACERLQELKITFKHKGVWKSWVLVPTAEIDENYEIYLRLNEDYVNYFRKLSDEEKEDYQISNGITYYQLAMIMSLKKKWSKRFYLFCCQYRVAQNFSYTFTDLKRNLGLMKFDGKGNVLSDSYKSIRRFEERVLSEAKKELFEKTDLYFDYKIKKKNGETHLSFEIKTTGKEGLFQMQIGFNETDPEKSKTTLNLKNKLRHLGMNDKHINIALAHIDNKHIKYITDFIEKKLANDKNSIDKPAAYILTSFKELKPDLEW